MLVHNVFFTLHESTPAARDRLVAACKQYLTGHHGEVFFAVGLRATELARDVNDQTFDVALTIGFADQAAHDVYQDAPRHEQFIAENKTTWKQVRVFDAMA